MKEMSVVMTDWPLNHPNAAATMLARGKVRSFPNFEIEETAPESEVLEKAVAQVKQQTGIEMIPDRMCILPGKLVVWYWLTQGQSYEVADADNLHYVRIRGPLPENMLNL